MPFTPLLRRLTLPLSRSASTDAFHPSGASSRRPGAKERGMQGHLFFVPDQRHSELIRRLALSGIYAIEASAGRTVRSSVPVEPGAVPPDHQELSPEAAASHHPAVCGASLRGSVTFETWVTRTQPAARGRRLEKGADRIRRARRSCAVRPTAGQARAHCARRVPAQLRGVRSGRPTPR
jgi:hypothetical protein